MNASGMKKSVCTNEACRCTKGVFQGLCFGFILFLTAGGCPPPPPGSVPGAFTLSSPADGDYSISTTPTLSWNASVGATSYTLEVATNSSFGVADVLNLATSTTSFTVTTLLTPGVIYYWQVTAVNSLGTTVA